MKRRAVTQKYFVICMGISMKVLQINSHYDQGGAARIVAALHRQLLRRGVESHVAYGRGAKHAEENVHFFGDTPGIYISAIGSRLLGINGYFNKRATGKLIQLIEKIQPDMVHMHVLHGYYVNVPMLFHYINKVQIPCIWTFHDCHAFTGKCGYFFDCRQWEQGCKSCPYLKSYPSSLLLDCTRKMWKDKKGLFTVGEKKWIVTPSFWLQTEVEKSFFSKYSCVTINNGIDTENTFYPRDREALRKKYGFLSEEKLILGVAVGYRDERKGVEYIIQLAKDLEKRAKVILIGWNKENNGLLKGCENIITLKNILNKDMLADYYSMADVFVIPSLAENYPTTSLEAMACGTPVVGFGVGGITEQLETMKGLVVEASNQKAFTEAVSKTLWEPGVVLQGDALARMIQEKNSAGRMVDDYLKLYQEIIKK